MMAVALAVAWAGYAVGMWGYCLVRGYDVPFSGVLKPVWPGGGTTVAPNANAGGTPGAPGGSGAPVILA